MKIIGEVTSGLGKAEFFLSQEFYKKEFLKHCGFIPYPGTLNIIVCQDYLNKINSIKNDCENIIESKGNFGSVKYVHAILNNEVKGAIVFPDKSVHDENYLEFIASFRLRDAFNLKDGDKISIILEV